MEKFISHEGVAVPLLQDNIDTDAIIPSHEMKRVSKLGLGEGLFATWRYLGKDSRELNPEFVLNKPGYSNASILLSADNFGCGSSREHAVWTLKDYGIRCIIAQGFGSIFARNCLRNGILVIELEAKQIQKICSCVEPSPQLHRVGIDLPSQTIHLNNLTSISFDIVENDKNMLLNGLDQIAMTQMLSSEIQQFSDRDRIERPWMYNLIKRVRLD